MIDLRTNRIIASARAALRGAMIGLVCLLGLQMAAASSAHANGRVVLAILPELPAGMTLADICGDLGIAGAEHPCPHCVAAAPSPVPVSVPGAPDTVSALVVAQLLVKWTPRGGIDHARAPRAPPAG